MVYCGGRGVYDRRDAYVFGRDMVLRVRPHVLWSLAMAACPDGLHAIPSWNSCPLCRDWSGGNCGRFLSALLLGGRAVSRFALFPWRFSFPDRPASHEGNAVIQIDPVYPDLFFVQYGRAIPIYIPENSFLKFNNFLIFLRPRPDYTKLKLNSC